MAVLICYVQDNTDTTPAATALTFPGMLFGVLGLVWLNLRFCAKNPWAIRVHQNAERLIGYCCSPPNRHGVIVDNDQEPTLTAYTAPLLSEPHANSSEGPLVELTRASEKLKNDR